MDLPLDHYGLQVNILFTPSWVIRIRDILFGFSSYSVPGTMNPSSYPLSVGLSVDVTPYHFRYSSKHLRVSISSNQLTLILTNAFRRKFFTDGVLLVFIRSTSIPV